jgi:hypothetical protein
MPTYDFLNTETGKIWTATMPYDDKEAYMKENNCRAYFKTTPTLISSVGDVWSKTDEGFKRRMKGIHKTGGSQSKLE